MYDLTAFQRDLLTVAAGLEKPKGLALKTELEKYYTSDIHHGRLYPNLDELCEKGLLEKHAKDRRTNAYVLTARGERELQDHRSWEDEYLDGVVEADADAVTADD